WPERLRRLTERGRHERRDAEVHHLVERLHQSRRELVRRHLPLCELVAELLEVVGHRLEALRGLRAALRLLELAEELRGRFQRIVGGERVEHWSELLQRSLHRHVVDVVEELLLLELDELLLEALDVASTALDLRIALGRLRLLTQRLDLALELGN